MIKNEKRVQSRKILWSVMKANHLDTFIYSYIAMIIFVASLLVVTEPQIDSFSSALWYCFALVSTTGFGDYVAVSAVGRVISVLLGLYSIIFFALVTGIFVNFYQEKMKEREHESISLFLDKLENLNDLSDEELKEISEKVKKIVER